MDVFLLPKKKLISFQIIILGFLRVIVLMRIEGRYPILIRGERWEYAGLIPLRAEK